jgi:medium-chain acyl-[acyl-carrier-protein] hydrolase
MQRVKLFCLPYAGGSAMVYSTWKKSLLPGIEVIPIELAGRGGRAEVPFYSSLAGDGVEDVYNQIACHLDGSPFAIFGHSMGALFTYEVGQRIRLQTGQAPSHLFFSGRGAPHRKLSDKIIHSLPDAEFQEEILRLGGTPKEIFEQAELAQIFLPILRSDYRLVETYESVDQFEPMDCDFTILRGTEDRYTREDAEEWRHYTKRRCHIEDFQGNHFFIHSHKQQVIDLVRQRCL